MPVIKSLGYRKVLNSHVEFTTEFVLGLQDGTVGMGASPKGETISIFEDKRVSISPEMILQRMEAEGVFDKDLTQADFDESLESHIGFFGRNNAYSLSLAFHNAAGATALPGTTAGGRDAQPSAPRLCCNILNGGWHAYTNPVLSDFPEYLLVAKSADTEQVIEQHQEIQRVVGQRLLQLPKSIVAGHPVSRFATADNRECIDFLLGIRDGLGLEKQFDLMIDASAGDLWGEGGYRFAVTDNSVRPSPELCAYWEDLIRQYQLGFLEDPFREQDLETWRDLTKSQTQCRVIGDNFYSSDARRLAEGAARGCTHGIIIKPNQAGTITAVIRAVETAHRCGQIAIASHRSISTEETFLSTLTCCHHLPYIKIGPLLTDYSSVLRLNAILRLTTVCGPAATERVRVIQHS